MTLSRITRWILILALLFFGGVGFFAFFNYWETTPLGQTPMPAGPHMLAWLGLLVFGVCGLLGAWGLYRYKNFGYTFGYLVAAGILLMFTGEAYSHSMVGNSFSARDIFWSLLFLFTPILLYLGLRWIRLKDLQRGDHELLRSKD